MIGISLQFLKAKVLFHGQSYFIYFIYFIYFVRRTTGSFRRIEKSKLKKQNKKKESKKLHNGTYYSFHSVPVQWKKFTRILTEK